MPNRLNPCRPEVNYYKPAACCLVIAVLTVNAFPYQTGTLPGSTGASGPLPASFTRTAPSCGNCHTNVTGTVQGPGGAVQGAPAIDMAITVPKHALDQGETINVNVTTTGGVTSSPLPNAGGFTAEITAGTLIGAMGVQVDPTGKFATHVNAFTAQRNWNFSMMAPSTAGLIEMFGVTNTTNGSGNNAGDAWAFHGFDDTAMQATPVRFYALAAGITHIGNGCADGYGNYAVLGADQTPAIGNTAFAFHLHGCAPSTIAFLMLSFAAASPPLDLTAFGLPGCTSHIPLPIPATLAGFTSPGNAQRAEGSISFPFSVPSDPSFTGMFIYAQGAYADPSAALAGRNPPFTLSNALQAILQ